jgi:hypothetical protein
LNGTKKDELIREGKPKGNAIESLKQSARAPTATREGACAPRTVKLVA